MHVKSHLDFSGDIGFAWSADKVCAMVEGGEGGG